jgi:Putative transposase
LGVSCGLGGAEHRSIVVRYLSISGRCGRSSLAPKTRRGEFLVPVAVLSRKIAAEFAATLKAKAPAVFAAIPTRVWKLSWVSFCRHYGQGNDAALTNLSRNVFRTAISSARILGMDQTHVPFRVDWVPILVRAVALKIIFEGIFNSCDNKTFRTDSRR